MTKAGRRKNGYRSMSGFLTALLEHVGRVEQSDTHHRVTRVSDGFREGSTHTTRCDLRALARIAQRNGTADAGARAGDDRDMVAQEPGHVCSPP
jgi:hypothetical protein